MLSRALILAAVAFLLGSFGMIPARAQNLEAGKPPSQIFSSTCSLCHKSARGLLKSVSPGSLPGFLRQHYTTSSDMASAMSAYVLSNGAANAPVAGGNLTKQGQEAKSGAPKQAARDGAKPDADGLQGPPPAAAAADPAALAAKQKAAAERRAARLAAKSKADAPPKIEDRHTAPKDAPASDAAAKTDGDKPESADSSKTETAKLDGTRPDPVPAVTPAPKDGDSGPKEIEKPAAVAAAPPKDDVPSGPLTIDMGPPPAPRVAVPGPAAVPAGKPEPPISR